MQFLRIIIFQILISLRGIILGISKLLAILFLTFFIILITFKDFQTAPFVAKAMALGLGIIFTLINWFYDYLVLYFSPKNMDVTLYR